MRDAGNCTAQSVVNELRSAISAIEKASAATAANQLSMAALRVQIAQRYQEAGDYRSQEAIERSKGDVSITDRCKNIAEITRWQNAAVAARSSAMRLESSVEIWEKVTSATAANNQELSLLWQKSALQYQESAEYYRQQGEATVNKNMVEATRCNTVAIAAERAAQTLANEAREAAKKK